MLYYLFDYLNSIDFPGAGVFQYLSFRSAMAVIVSLLITTIWGKRVIRFMQVKQIGEEIRDLGLEGQYEKKGTPTMGGVIILFSILIPVLLFADIANVYVILMLVTTVWLGSVGFIDDYIKVFKKDKKGLAGKFKVMGQVGLGLIVGLTLYFNDNVVLLEKHNLDEPVKIENAQGETVVKTFEYKEAKSTLTTIPFVKNNEFDYSQLVSFMGKYSRHAAWIIFVIAVIFIITAVSNGANLTDGLDGLATGTSAIMGVTLGILAYLSGNAIYSDYLNIMYIPNSGELVVFMGAFIGATVGFLWYNSFPAQIFMGDTGSLAIGGIIATFAIVIRKELLIPILAGIFLVESMSVMIQVSYFKHTKRKYGEGKRIFLMTPIHHHFQKKGFAEPKIVTRFWIVGIILAVLTIVTLKTR
ncbi:MAG: phospho-N-acetylmuramoyl-pentapeptide-transferase [Bacteroidales bacterium]|jgi:phospho-N-acetylmuramoyl-pentapeptide-transferase|nr:phospho-N-acetylmuramoyl-pentapeptide-transferase [Bacteroidales bacterium]